MSFFVLKISIIACMASERANKARIEVGKTLDANGFWQVLN